MINLKLHSPSRLTWTFWPEKEFTDIYENIYVRTFTEDWFLIVESIAKNLSDKTNLLDVGCGEGHTTKQILDRIESQYICDILEPSVDAIKSAQNFLSQENSIGDIYPVSFKDFVPDKNYDAVFTSHTNYYWAEDEKSYKSQLEKFIGLVKKDGKALMLTLPEGSDQYKVLSFDPYKPFVRSEYAETYYKSIGQTVEVVDFSMRLYVGDFFTTRSLFDVKIFYQFLHGAEKMPSDKEAIIFRDKINEVRSGNYLNFKDRLLIITRIL